MPTVLEPWSSHRDVVCCALALGLDEDGSVLDVLTVPGLEGIKQLQTVAGGGNIHLQQQHKHSKHAGVEQPSHSKQATTFDDLSCTNCPCLFSVHTKSS